MPAHPGDLVIEGGCGAGAGLLCLAARVPDVRGVGIEAAAEMVGLAKANLAANGMSFCRIEHADIAAAPRLGPADHAFANPPWHDAAGTASPDTLRDTAKRAPRDVAMSWCRALSASLRPRGTLTLILPAARLTDWIGSLADSNCGSIALLPLWPRAGQPAKLAILQAIRGGRGPFRLLPGLTLHGAAGYTPATDAILRDGAPLVF